MVEHLDKLPQTGWGVIALVAGGLLLLIGMMVRGLLTQRQINSAVNHRQIGEPTLVAMVSEIHANHRQLSSDVRYIRSEVNGLQQWRAGYDGSELATGVGVANFLHEMRDGLAECKREMRETQKMVTTYGCPVRLQQEQACLKPKP